MPIQKQRYSAKEEQRLMSEIWDPRITEDPEAFVMFAYPWGKKDTPLEHFDGPRNWQREVLQAIKHHIKENKDRVAKGKEPKMLKLAVASGRGIGKSALVAWLNQWHMSCRIGATSIITANSENQLKSRTWAEAGKWKTMMINSHWFEFQTLKLFPAKWFSELLKEQLQIDTTYYYSEAQLWSEENPDAFAGIHNPKGVMLIMDESSGVPQNIWDVSTGFFTDRSLYHFQFAFSNPRRGSGAFFECFHKNRKYWHRMQIDSRDVEGINKDELDAIVDQYGEDSFQARVEVRGLFPKQGERQFIPREIVIQAMEREDIVDDHAALIMGVDVARFGDDKSVIVFRKGRNLRYIETQKYDGKDNMELANICAEMIAKYNPDAVCIDAGGGTGVIDRLREMNYKVHEVWFGSKSNSPEYRDKRMQLWADMKAWLGGACIPDDQELLADLTGPEYDFAPKSDALFLESKEKMKKRGLASPDYGDALATTFAVKVARSDKSLYKSGRPRVAKGMDYDIFG